MIKKIGKRLLILTFLQDKRLLCRRLDTGIGIVWVLWSNSTKHPDDANIFMNLTQDFVVVLLLLPHYMSEPIQLALLLINLYF